MDDRIKSDDILMVFNPCHHSVVSAVDPSLMGPHINDGSCARADRVVVYT